MAYRAGARSGFSLGSHCGVSAQGELIDWLLTVLSFINYNAVSRGKVAAVFSLLEETRELIISTLRDGHSLRMGNCEGIAAVDYKSSQVSTGGGGGVHRIVKWSSHRL